MNERIAQMLVERYLREIQPRFNPGPIPSVYGPALRSAIVYVDKTQSHKCWCACDCTEAEA